MKKEYKLRITGNMYDQLRAHLFPGDGKEAAALALCGRAINEDTVQLLVHELVLIPYDECLIRESNLVRWSTKRLIPLLEIAEKKNLSILKIHSHPTWYEKFSGTDDQGDKELFSSVYGWVNDFGPHASAVMLPDGSLFARMILEDLSFVPIDKIISVGDDIQIWASASGEISVTEHNIRTAQAFGDKTTLLLNQLRIGIVGCSGTGSLVIEQLYRLKVCELVLIDPEPIEDVNLNRIPNTTVRHAEASKLKVDVLKEAIETCGLGTRVIAVSKNIYYDTDIIRLLATCDIIFGCMDSVDGRHLLNRIATFYLIPYFDLGVKLISDGNGGINKILAVVHYLQPGKSSLMTRNVYNSEELRAASLKRTNTDLYNEQKQNKYITDIDVPSPAVISINMQAASMAVNDFLARLHPFRYSCNKEYATSIFDITDWSFHHEREGIVDNIIKKYVGRGDMPRILDIDLK